MRAVNWGAWVLLSRRRMVFFAAAVLFGFGLACSQSARPGDAPGWRLPTAVLNPAITLAAPTSASGQPQSIPFSGTPTPDKPHPLPTLRSEPELYVVQRGDTLGVIAGRFGVSLEQIVGANQLANPNLLEVGQTLAIPVPTPSSPGPGYKIIPNSELVYGPASVGFELAGFIQTQAGYLAGYREEIDEETALSGVEIVQKGG